jgi:hypothetical protein
MLYLQGDKRGEIAQVHPGDAIAKDGHGCADISLQVGYPGDIMDLADIQDNDALILAVMGVGCGGIDGIYARLGRDGLAREGD